MGEVWQVDLILANLSKSKASGTLSIPLVVQKLARNDYKVDN